MELWVSGIMLLLGAAAIIVALLFKLKSKFKLTLLFGGILSAAIAVAYAGLAFILVYGFD